jgi:hypothetical protein
MKISVTELRKMVGEIVSEAKKKKPKQDKPSKGVKPQGYSSASALDFSAPLGPHNLYKQQGVSNWGPLTGPGSEFDDNELEPKDVNEQALRSVVRSVISEQSQPQNIWEKAMHWYDNQKLGLGRQTSEGIAQKKVANAKKATKGRK